MPPAAIIVIPDTLLVPPVSFTVIKVACGVVALLMPNCPVPLAPHAYTLPIYFTPSLFSKNKENLDPAAICFIPDICVPAFPVVSLTGTNLILDVDVDPIPNCPSPL